MTPQLVTSEKKKSLIKYYKKCTIYEKSFNDCSLLDNHMKTSHKETENQKIVRKKKTTQQILEKK